MTFFFFCQHKGHTNIHYYHVLLNALGFMSKEHNVGDWNDCILTSGGSSLLKKSSLPESKILQHSCLWLEESHGAWTHLSAEMANVYEMLPSRC